MPAHAHKLRSWAVLLAASLALTLAMRAAHVPAALMLGPMVSGIVVAIFLPGAALPRRMTMVAQAFFGCLIAHSLSPALLTALAPHWPVLLGINLATLIGILGLGVLVTRTQWLPGTAGIWGMSPGGAGAMVLLAESYGSDKRIVAVMQYLRLVIAVLVVIALGTAIGVPHAGASPMPGGTGTDWLAPPDPIALALTLLLGLTGIGVALAMKSAILVLLVPMFGGIAVQALGWPAPAAPAPLAAAAFAIVGWHTGLSFTRAALLHSARLAPRILIGIAGILALCAAMAVLFARVTGASFLTAYMALNPGGADTVLAMAGTISVDLPLILAVQISRVVLTVILAPLLGRWAAGHHLRRAEPIPAAEAAEATRLAYDVDEVI